MKTRLSIGVVALAILGLFSFTGCSDDKDGNGNGDGDFTTSGFPIMSVFDDGLPVTGDAIALSVPSTEVGQAGSASTIRLQNAGTSNLVIQAIEIIDQNPPNVFALNNGFVGLELEDAPYKVAHTGETDLSIPREFIFGIEMVRQPVGITPTAKLRIRSNARLTNGNAQTIRDFELVVEGAKPSILVIPAIVNFGTVSANDVKQSQVSIANVGTDKLIISKFFLSGNPNLELVLGTQQYPVSPETVQEGITLAEPIEVAPGESHSVAVRYVAADDSEARGELRIISNDTTEPNGKVVPIQANVGGPCLQFVPIRVAYGGKLVGRTASTTVEVRSCGDTELEITEISLRSDSSQEFSLNLASLPNPPSNPGRLAVSDTPLKLGPNAVATIEVQYFPEDISPFVEGRPIEDTGIIQFRSNDARGLHEYELSGFGVEKECPTAVIRVAEGEEVIPQTVLHLIGSQSYAATGTIQSYFWEVDQPNGSRSVFRQSNQVADPTFEVNVAGQYRFRLSVTDSSGEESCVPAEVTVQVNPDEAIHVELLWDTPGDPDQFDTRSGADLDLHFAHPFAAGGYDGDRDGRSDPWFDNVYDCFWANNHPNWGNPSSLIDDNPSLDRDDADGTGPENINLKLPEENVTYRVGVHYWNDHGFGKSYALVRIYTFGSLVFEESDRELVIRDMWEVAEIKWPPAGQLPKLIQVCEGTNTRCDTDSQCGGNLCTDKIVPNYNHPAWLLNN